MWGEWQSLNLQTEYTDIGNKIKEKGKGVLLTRNDVADEIKVLEKEQGDNFNKLYIDLLLKEHANLSQQLANGLKLTNKDMINFANNSLAVVNKNNSNQAKFLK